jgi:hypothetical protein
VDHHRGAGDDEQADGGWDRVRGQGGLAKFNLLLIRLTIATC